MAAVQAAVVACEDVAEGDRDEAAPATEKKVMVCRGRDDRQILLARTMTCSTEASEFDVSDLASPSCDFDSIPPTPNAVALSVVHDVVASPSGEPMLLAASGEAGELPFYVADLPGDTPLVIRVFRFFETKSDAATPWERELRNVNSGSLLWVPVHMQPKMHSMAGAKYGDWFTVHHIEVLAKHFKSGYFMCEEGSCPLAKTFGSTRGVEKLVTGKNLPEGYFWFVTPHREIDGDSLERLGWRHLSVEGPFDGTSFLKGWKAGGMPTEATSVQEMVNALLTGGSGNK
mmetsp:Transcript_68470/g.198596  ORF Transcript_68470/g.198596 Transcript_68470/m.198596 type:complete len:287 (-) Transcript_68470:465-1325(-)|eukprot:CAMPEP_0176060476 /NCGR_PEP_ID=MMETSP0120_2-20121206/30143_1 /TAXON_ID=160619 /ORGANISM="Kryptoperidinium foliaceum, Strain CCMP 1326" /LENGTH=286 /DNA_ID=CAMNT_0017394019 /DNA_START=75 /DNA_END=935 /DNA_ORIENTATION=+